MTTTPSCHADPLDLLAEEWLERWPEALAVWSSFTMLSPPRLCRTEEDERQEALSGSFAMIRLVDHAVVISLPQIRDNKLEGFAVPILAHEIGHHVYTPANLQDNARLQACVRKALPTREQYAGLVANLFTDLLINDRLERCSGLDMAGVYRALKTSQTTRLWALYLRMYEILWSLPSGTLVDLVDDPALQADAQLGVKVLRVYARDWLTGASRFAVLLLPYLLELPNKPANTIPSIWFDADQAGAGEEIPDGMAGTDDAEDDVIHPAEDKAITGAAHDAEEKTPPAGGRERIGGQKNDYRSPTEYRDLMKSLGVRVTEKDLTMRYYRERALPHLIRFPTREVAEAADPIPEGVETWEPGQPLQDIDWTETVSRGPDVIPGVTTVQRVFGESEGHGIERVPPDLYIGIDCSGSMSNPAYQLSYPVLAGTVLALSALRGGAKVMACLSGDPGRYCETKGFVRNERDLLAILTDYLGTGYAFGIRRLEETFGAEPLAHRTTHILIVSDSDIFDMLKEVKNGWKIVADALLVAGGGGTFVLEIERSQFAEPIARLESLGWRVHCIRNQQEMVAFARAFSRNMYGQGKERS